MCRNIKTLFNFEPHATNEEVHAASLQFVRKISGFNFPSKINEKAFNLAVEEIAHSASHLLINLSTNAEPKNREIEATKVRERATKRFEKSPTLSSVT